MGNPSSLIKKIVVGVGCALLTVFLGWWLGTAYGERRLNSTRTATNAEWTQRLAKDVVGIAVGSQFPSFPVWSVVDEAAVTDVRELLPEGGILVSVSPTCHVCVDVAVALHAASQTKAGDPCPVALVLEGESYQALMDELTERKISFPVYRDVEQALFHVHNVTSNPTFFSLDTAGVVHHLGAGLRTPEEFASLMEELRPTREMTQ